MAHYYFNFRSEWNTVLDEQGLDLLDICAAREKAIASVSEDFAKTGSAHPPYSIIITDASGREVATIDSRERSGVRHSTGRDIAARRQIERICGRRCRR